MALKIARELQSGIVTEVHRIIGTVIDFNNHFIEITVASYVNGEKRETEIANEKALKDFVELKAKLDDLVQNATEENEQERQELSEQINEIVENGQPTTPDLSIATFKHRLFLTGRDKYNRSDLYKYLKTLPEYAGAEDV